MSFELLDDILLESKENTKETKEEKPEGKEETKEEEAKEEMKENIEDVEFINSLVESMENVIYSDLDQLIENSMRTSLRVTITESSIPPETKVDQLSIVEKAVFTQDQMTKFVNENIHPILECAGVFNGTYNFGGSDPVAVSLPIFETALLLYVANEGLLESNVEEDKNDPQIKNSLYTSMIEESQKQAGIDIQTSLKIINEHLLKLYEKYGVETDNSRESLLDEAVRILNENGMDNLRPSFYDLAECVCEYNRKAEINGEDLFGDILSKDEELKESENIFVSALNRMNTKLSGLIAQSVKNRANNISENTNDDTIAIANTATGISSMVTWREEKLKCNKPECLENALKETINSVKAQYKSCGNTNNVKLCETCNKKIEEKWNIYMKDIVK